MNSARAADDAATTLVVPVDVAGLCIGQDDAQHATGGFAGATAVYQQQVTAAHGAYLGGNVNRGYHDPPWDQLQAGIHLHWALPDGLTRGGGPGAELDFPAAPNRWLVTRIAISGGTPATRSWLIESDALAADPPPPGASSVTLPVRPSPQLPHGFGYLGRTHDLSAGPPAQSAAGGPAIADAAGTPLNAVCNGEAGFAAYYPSCRGVFGFWDTMDDLSPPASEPAQLAYSVIGWYDNPAQDDPVQPGATPAQLEAARGWTFTPAAAPPSRSVYSGVLQGIGWSPHIAYVHGQPVQQPLPAKAAIGNTSAEALAAYFRAGDQPGVPLFETLLDAFQSGLAPVFTQPAAGGLTQLHERLHDQRFAGIAAGTVYSIVSSRDQGPGPRQLIGLPAQLAGDLDELNVLRQQADQCAAHADWYRWQLFADWYRIFMIDPARQNDAQAIAQRRYAGWAALAQKRDALAAAATGQYTKVNAQLRTGMRLRSGPAVRFVQPSDPAVLITGAAAGFPERYGGDGRFAGGFLRCRTGGQLLTTVTAGNTTLTAASLTGVTAPAGLPGPALLTALLREACLLSTALLADLSGQAAPALQAALELALQGSPQGVYALGGQPPSPVGVNWWAPGQWLPVFACWTVQYLPLQPARPAGAPVSYPATIINANFRLDQDAGGTLAYAPSGGPGSITIDPATAAFPQQYTGSGNLTPTPARTLTRLLQDYPDTHTDATLSAVLTELTSGNGFLVAPLNGLADALTMHQRGVQLQVQVPSTSKYADLTKLIAPIAGDAPKAGGPDVDGNFNPLRAGYLKLALTLVDVFGQKRDVQIPELTCASSMTAVAGGAPVPSVAYLAPRIAQPARLAFHWLAADGSGTEEMTGNPAISPVCGWLLPNHADGSLAIYDQQGRPLGTLFPEHGGSSPAVGWQSAPGDARTIGQDLATVMAHQNPQLREVALALGGPGATAQMFTAMWKVIDTAGETIQPGPLPTDSDLAVLVGRPIALVQAAVRLELQGAAMLDLSAHALGTDSDAGLTGVQFPVVLGDLADLSDGLIGYFKQAAAARPGPGPEPGHPPAPRTHTVVEGDNLWDIAARYLGDGERWHEIYALNEGKPQPDGGRLTDPNLIQPGWVLVLPPSDAPPPPPAAPQPPAKPPPPASPPGPGAGYDLTTFYSQGAGPGFLSQGAAGATATSAVVRPAQDTLCVTPTPPPDPDGAHEPPDLTPYTQKVLMLMDPRTQVHATTGILPTATLELPAGGPRSREERLRGRGQLRG